MTATSIEWTDYTWNPVTGCDKVSPGCDHCYAETIARRFAGTPQFPNGFGVTLRPERLADPARWRKPRMVFTNSVADLFHDAVPDLFIAQVFAVMAAAPRHTFQVLTKRPGRMRSLLSRPDFREFMAQSMHFEDGNGGDSVFDWLAVNAPWPLPNIWLGVSAETQRWADIRIPQLLTTPAAVRFVSAEPLLGPVDLSRWLPPAPDPQPGLDWVIAGGESGPGARPMHPAWVRSLRDQCEGSTCDFFFKQWGQWTTRSPSSWPVGDAWAQPGRHCWIDPVTSATKPFGDFTGTDDLDWALMHRVGKKAAGRELDGRTWNEMPDTAREAIAAG